MVILPPICQWCVHDRGDNTCDVFPRGIPLEITLSRFDHREPFEGDGGLIFEPVDQEAAERAEEHFKNGPFRPLPDGLFA